MDWQTFTAVIGIPAVGVLIAWTVRLQARIGMTERDLSHFMVEVAKSYVTKNDIEHVEQTMNKRFDRLEQKVDTLITSGKCGPAKQ